MTAAAAAPATAAAAARRRLEFGHFGLERQDGTTSGGTSGTSGGTSGTSGGTSGTSGGTSGASGGTGGTSGSRGSDGTDVGRHLRYLRRNLGRHVAAPAARRAASGHSSDTLPPGHSSGSSGGGGTGDEEVCEGPSDNPNECPPEAAGCEGTECGGGAPDSTIDYGNCACSSPVGNGKLSPSSAERPSGARAV